MNIDRVGYKIIRIGQFHLMHTLHLSLGIYESILPLFKELLPLFNDLGAGSLFYLSSWFALVCRSSALKLVLVWYLMDGFIFVGGSKDLFYC